MTSEIQRYDANYDKYDCHGGSVEESSDGEYVRYKDYERIVAELSARCERLNRECQNKAMRLIEYQKMSWHMNGE